MDVWMDVCMNRNVWMQKRMYGWMHGWMDVWVDVGMDE